jgi:hypothetical protein
MREINRVRRGAARCAAPCGAVLPPVEAVRARFLDAGQYTFLWLDALTQKVRGHGRMVTVHAHRGLARDHPHQTVHGRQSSSILGNRDDKYRCLLSDCDRL